MTIELRPLVRATRPICGSVPAGGARIGGRNWRAGCRGITRNMGSRDVERWFGEADRMWEQQHRVSDGDLRGRPTTACWVALDCTTSCSTANARPKWATGSAARRVVGASPQPPCGRWRRSASMNSTWSVYRYGSASTTRRADGPQSERARASRACCATDCWWVRPLRRGAVFVVARRPDAGLGAVNTTALRSSLQRFSVTDFGV